VQVVLTEGRDVTSVPMHVRFDPEVLDFVAATTGPALQTGSLQPILLASVNPQRPGDLAVGLSMPGSSGTFTGSGTLILLEFEARRAGGSDLALARTSVRAVTGEPLPARLDGCSVEVR